VVQGWLMAEARVKRMAMEAEVVPKVTAGQSMTLANRAHYQESMESQLRST
jgi:hypothetical protein